jgi:hypothetical protein
VRSRFALELLLVLTSSSLTMLVSSCMPTEYDRESLESGGEDSAPQSRGSGTEICARCGARREVENHDDEEPPKFVVSFTEEERWSVPRIGACKQHCWQETGCWSSHGPPVRLPDGSELIDEITSCTMLDEHHVLWSALSKLESAHAGEMAKRFADLPPGRLIELWRESNHNGATRDSSAEQIARDLAKSAGWSDLAAYWFEAPGPRRSR